MNYPKYLEIPSYEDCLEIVKEHTAFSHSTQEWKTDKIESFKYNLVTLNMWEGDGRLNMRGLTFCNGELVALPWPKFFNRGENEATKNVDFTKVKYIFEKVDGSLISFFRVAEDIELKSMKSIESDVSHRARAYAETRPDVYSFVEKLLDKALSPMFEYVSPNNKIVLNYEENFIFLGARNLLTGEILYPVYDIEVPESITHPAIFDNMEEAKEFLTREDVEGIVLTFENGLMMKMKTEHYCRIHKLLDNFVPKNLVANLAEGSFDDVIGLLTDNGLENEIALARKIESRFWGEVNSRKIEAEAYYKANSMKERKEVARDLLPNRKEVASLVFKLFDGQDLVPYIMKKLKKEAKEWTFE